VRQLLRLATLDFESVEDTRALRHKDQLPLPAILTALVLCLASKVKTPRAMEEELSQLKPKQGGVWDWGNERGYRTLVSTRICAPPRERMSFDRRAQVKFALACKQIQNDTFAGA